MHRVSALMACAIWVASASAVGAECIAAPQLGLYQEASPDSAAGRTSLDALGRIVAPISINGQGPFRFIVDTGANRSVMSQELADRLGLRPEGTGEVHSVHGVSVAPLVRVQSLAYATLALGGEQVPILQSAVLAGEQGLLGVDGMAGRRLRLDFDRNCIEILPSRLAHRLPGWTVLNGELRFGTLMVVHGAINGLSVHLLLDTGSDTSLANESLRSALNARVHRDRARFDVAVGLDDGRPIVLENAIALPSLSIGGGTLEARDITAYVGDFHIFQLWRLIEEPTLLLGMDVLSQTRGIAIDYERHTVAIRIHDAPPTGTRLQDYDRSLGGIRR